MRSWDRCVHTLRLSCQVLDNPGGQKSCVHWPVMLPWLSCVQTVRVTTHPSSLLTQPCPRLSCASCRPALWERLSQDAEEGTRLWGHACPGPCSSQRLRWDWGQVSQPCHRGLHAGFCHHLGASEAPCSRPQGCPLSRPCHTVAGSLLGGGVCGGLSVGR